MRHGASLLTSMEGMSRLAFRIARELSSNSRSGLTVRFLSKKLEIPQEEVEYLLDVNHKLIFTDLTKIKIVAEGLNAVKRVSDGLENHGDVPSLNRRVKALSPHDFRRLEEQLDLEQPCTKKTASEMLLNRYYKRPDSVVSYVATRGFSATAREVFDILWQSKDGLMPVSQIRVAHGGPEFEVEQALWELFRGFALFELFRFDPEERLVRVAGLLSELRQYRESAAKTASNKLKLRSLRARPEAIQSQGLGFSDALCKLVAAIAARPARLRGDGDLFREDRRRMSEVLPESANPSVNTCLWVAEGAGWLARVDNTLRAGSLGPLIGHGRVQRQRILFDWFTAHGNEQAARHLLAKLLDDLHINKWYRVSDVMAYAAQSGETDGMATLIASGAHWEYAGPNASNQTKSHLARVLEESFFWLGMVDRALVDGDSVFRVTELGEMFLRNTTSKKLEAQFPPRKGEFVVQPNFDIVVPTQDMDPLLTVPLDHFATRASSGQATVYNVTKESFTQAVQEGRDASAFVEFLLRHNRGDGLPANVMATLEDWRGTMKRVRLRVVHVLESDDPLIMADLQHRKRFNKYFTPLDPAKVVSYTGVSRAELAKALEKDGFVVE